MSAKGTAGASTAQGVEGATRTAHRAAGQAYFESVLAKAKDGNDPFQQQPLKPLTTPSLSAAAATAAAAAEDPDIAAFGAFFERHKTALLVVAFIVLQAFSWILMKGAVNSMRTPAVLTFLHLVAAGAVQLLLACWQLVEQPQISSKAAKGAMVHAVLSSLQVLVLMAFLLYGSVCMMLCWVTLMPLLIGYTRAADVTRKAPIKAVPQRLRAPLTVAILGLGLEYVADSHSGLMPALMLLCWCCLVALQHTWQQVKQDATLGHSILDPGFLFHARELSDLEDALSPSSLAFLTACLPCTPILLLGLVCLEGKSLVDHEPSVPTLSVLVLSSLAFAGVVGCRIMLASRMGALPELAGFCMAAAAMLAIFLDFLKRGQTVELSSLLGAIMAVGGSLATHKLRGNTSMLNQAHIL